MLRSCNSWKHLKLPGGHCAQYTQGPNTVGKREEEVIASTKNWFHATGRWWILFVVQIWLGYMIEHMVWRWKGFWKSLCSPSPGLGSYLRLILYKSKKSIANIRWIVLGNYKIVLRINGLPEGCGSIPVVYWVTNLIYPNTIVFELQSIWESSGVLGKAQVAGPLLMNF